MRIIFLIALLAGVVPGIGYAQGKPAPPLPAYDRPLVIKMARTISVPSEMAGALIGPVLCDADGNVFLRKHGEDPLQSPILKFDTHGVRKAQYSLTDATPKFYGGDFFVSSDGEVYQSAWQKGGKEMFVFKYGKDGQIQTKIKLDSLFDPYGIAAFPSGDMLMTGVQADLKADDDKGGRPFTALFDSSGKLIRKLSLEDDAKLEQAAEQALRTGEVLVPNNTAITLGAVVAGSDGNIYVMRRAEDAIIYAIAPDGHVVSRWIISSDGNGLPPHTLASAKGRLAVMFKARRAMSPALVKVLDLATGSILETYDVDPALGFGLACYTPPEFTFVTTTRDKQLALYQAEPQ